MKMQKTNEHLMAPLIQARDLAKSYGAQIALDHVNFSVETGRIVGLIGPNGAGKTTALRAILGLTAYQGHLEVLGREPFGNRAALMNEATFIADVAVLPSWLKVEQAIDFVAGVHPRFRRDRARALLAKTQITGKRRIGELSKGMKTLVHLALTMAIDARLLVLDEPTLGLDILARREFYDALVNDYMDETRTILITTHQVEEVENLLTDVMFIDKGRIVLDCSLDDIAARYAAVAVTDDRVVAARAEHPFHERRMLGKKVLYFERPDFEKLAAFGEVLTPSVSDLFVAKLS
jgi:ABC-2 type transport system ATP-binding protein